MNQSTIISDSTQFRQIIGDTSTGIFPIRPKILFRYVEDLFQKPVAMNYCVPSSEIGSITTLEAALLISLIKITSPKTIFEFGTFLGYSTHLFLNNSNDDCLVYSIDMGNVEDQFQYTNDLPKETLIADDKINDNYLSYIQSSKGEFYLSEITESQRSRLRLLKQDSKTINVKSQGFANRMDMVFIDGGHDAETIRADTEHAFEMSSDQGVIIWHDFNSNLHKDVTHFVNDFAKNHKIFHVEHSMLAFCFVGFRE